MTFLYLVTKKVRENLLVSVAQPFFLPKKIYCFEGLHSRGSRMTGPYQAYSLVGREEQTLEVTAAWR